MAKRYKVTKCSLLGALGCAVGSLPYGVEVARDWQEGSRQGVTQISIGGMLPCSTG